MLNSCLATSWRSVADLSSYANNGESTLPTPLIWTTSAIGCSSRASSIVRGAIFGRCWNTKVQAPSQVFRAKSAKLLTGSNSSNPFTIIFHMFTFYYLEPVPSFLHMISNRLLTNRIIEIFLENIQQKLVYTLSCCLWCYPFGTILLNICRMGASEIC